MKKSLAQLFKSARKQLGLTQKQVAERAGIDSNTYARAERGVQKPQLENVVKIARALDINEQLAIKTYLSR